MIHLKGDAKTGAVLVCDDCGWERALRTDGWNESRFAVIANAHNARCKGGRLQGTLVHRGELQGGLFIYHCTLCGVRLAAPNRLAAQNDHERILGNCS